MSDEAEKNTATVVADLVKELYFAEILQIEHNGMKVPVLQTPDSMKMSSVKRFFDEYRDKPERRTGTATMTTMGAFVDHTNRFKDADSALFADANPTNPSITAVLDYHRQTAQGDPRFGTHRTHFAFPLSDEWKIWNAGNGKRMDPSTFAEFIENRLTDILVPTDLSNPESEAEKALASFAALTGGNFADPAKMLELSRGLSINVDEKVKQVTNLSSGEIQVQYEASHTDGSGQPIKVPNLFMIAIPVFDRGDVFRIAARLRYRTLGGRVEWFYDLYRADKVFRVAIDEAAAFAATNTGLPMFSGTPEA